ncbi:MAG: DUF551 domain-containing protein [Anaerostipes faecalis]|nr:DUF551 domain-containing protein [Anaerostipes faecalis]
MIDEKKLIERFEHTPALSKIAHNLVRIVEEQPKVGEWIPVSERLPNKEEFINAYLRKKCVAEFIVMIKWGIRPTTLYFTVDGKWVDEEWNAYDVIAWQPLPEPYKGGYKTEDEEKNEVPDWKRNFMNRFERRC